MIKDDVKVSVVICTYNRNQLLTDSILSVINQDFPPNQYEIIVVDNNSTDKTKMVVEQLSTSSNSHVRYIFEGRQGLSYARNTGIDAASGDVIVFTDDDIEAARNWLSEIWAAFSEPGVAAVGGPIRPIWIEKRPEWLVDSLLEPLTISEFSNAAQLGEFIYPDIPFGANMSFRKSVFEADIRFSTVLGRRGSSLLSNEENLLCSQLARKGMKIKFQSGAIIYHKIDPKRLDKRWFRRRYYAQGRSDAIFDICSDNDIYGNAIAHMDCLINANGSKTNFNQYCHYVFSKGYLHELLSHSQSTKMVSNLRLIRLFELLISKYDATIHSISDRSAILTARLEEGERDISVAQSELVECNERIKAIYESYSWLMTSPFRSMCNMLKRLMD